MNHPSRSSHEPLDRIEVVRGDITQLDVDAIVNAANEGLLGGGGVDGAIHQAAGPGLLQACLELPELRPRVRCPTGEARLTKGFLLKARYVIHTVGPVWHGGARGEPALLAAAYRNSLRLAGQNQLQSVAFSAISTGVYGYPLELAADIAINEVSRELTQWEGLERVLFVAFGADAHRALEQARARTIAAGDARQRV